MEVCNSDIRGGVFDREGGCMMGEAGAGDELHEGV